MFPLSTIRPLQIIIKPVSNGWVVELPNDNEGDLKPELTKIFSNVKEALTGDPKMQRTEEPQAPSPEDTVKIVRDNSLHIFRKFDEVLGFLKFKIEE